MMQPILLGPTSTAQTSGTAEKQPQSDELLAQDEKLTEKFSNLLDSAIDVSKNYIDADGDFSKLSIEDQQIIENLSDIVDSELVQLGADDQETVDIADDDVELSEKLPETQLVDTQLVDEQLIDENNEIDTEEIDSSDNAEVLVQSVSMQPLKDQPVQKQTVTDVDFPDEISDLEQIDIMPSVLTESSVAENAPVVKTENVQEHVSSPILAQIEAAQKIDTQVTDAQKMVQSGETAPSVKKLGTLQNDQLSALVNNKNIKTNDGDKRSVKGDLKSHFAESLKDAEGDSIKTSKEESFKADLPSQLIDSKNELLFTSHNNEVEKKQLSHILDGGLLRTSDISASGANKIINQNLHNASSPTALQQSLDIQSKHAATLLGDRVLMMINQGKQEVKIRLDPAELGSIHLKLHMHHDQLQLSIQTDVGQSKDIIEQNLPRLREQLAQQGVSLGQTSVEQQTQGQQQNANQQGGVATFADDMALQNGDDDMILTSIKIPHSADGIDYYA